MQNRTDYITAPVGWRTLSVRPEFIDGRLEYAGAIDGQWCVRTLSREHTTQALLRRIGHRYLQ